MVPSMTTTVRDVEDPLDWVIVDGPGETVNVTPSVVIVVADSGTGSVSLPLPTMMPPGPNVRV